MLVGDYRPTKRVGIEELEGALNVFSRRIDQAYEDADARQHYYEGAFLALSLVRFGNYEYPHELMDAFEVTLDNYIEGRKQWE